ncbi:MAG: PEGA domain-containing protein [Spirochaetaceae bacterium]|nr:MAG: PEGA domain-containing protein [Spirochaetaceae bacterium]
MKRNIIFWSVAAFFLIIGCVSISAQQRFEVRVSSNVSKVTVFINNRGMGFTPMSTSLVAGTYTFRGTLPGYQDFEKTVTVTSHTTVYFDMKKINEEPPRPTPTPPPSSFELKVSANVRGAQVYVDNQRVGTAPVSTRVSRGGHQVKVTADGYDDYSQSINVLGNMSLNAELQRRIMYYRLYISANVSQAKVSINGREYGLVPTEIKLEAGRYDVKVEKPGYQEYRTSVDLNRDTRINAELRSMQSTITIVVPSSILNRSTSRPEAQIKVSVDNRPQNSFTFTVERGRHRIRIESGGLAIEKDIDVAEGRNYTIQLGFDMSVREQ